MAIHGTPTYYSPARFVFSQAYVQDIVFGFGPNVNRFGSGRIFEFIPVSDPTIHVHATLTPRLYGHRANKVTLDRVLEDWYLIVDPNPLPQNLDFQIQWAFVPALKRHSIYITITGWSVLYFFPTPPLPSSYWLPPLP